MPLHVWLKEPQMQILVKGERIVPKEWRKRKFGLFKRRICILADNGSAVMFDASNVLMVKTVTQEEIKAAEERQKAALEAQGKQGGGKVQPAMMIPGMRRAGN